MALGYTDKVADDYLGQFDTRGFARSLTELHRHMGREHDGTTGAHLGSWMRTNGGTVSESGGAYTLRDKFGLVDSITTVTAGQVRINLSGSGLRKGPGDASVFWYPAEALLWDSYGSTRIGTRTALTFIVYLYDETGAAQNTGFSFTCGGLAA